jgi:transcriptional regulator with XRE-family HTH domain
MQKTVEDNGLNVRIASIISHLGISQTAFAKSLGTTTSRITNITQGRNKPDSQLLAAVVKTYPAIDATWLLTGEGDINRNVNFPSDANAEYYTARTPENPSLNPSQNPSLAHNTPQKRRGKKDFSEMAKRLLEEPQNTDSFFRMGSAEPENEPEGTNKQVFISYSPDDAPYVAALQRLLDLQQRQQATNIQQRLEKMLARLRKVQELIEELLGIPFDDKNFRALQHRIVRRPRFSDDDPFDKMSEAAKTAHNEARERLLEQCEVELDHHLNTLFMGISYGKIEDAEPRKGSAAEVLKDLLDKRRGEGGKWRALVAEEEAV